MLDLCFPLLHYFFETGSIITPFLPGNTLLFTVGALAARSYFSVRLCIALFVIAAFAGGAVNYGVGKQFGMSRFWKDSHSPMGKYLGSAVKRSFTKHGGKAVVISRLLPIFRTMVPFATLQGPSHGSPLRYLLDGSLATFPLLERTLKL
ncbi:MAG: VTT domain-containing protein [Candidatus Xiphinematobacter sp.]|nr:MAG: VTT domain-containing protein [Candidatus Xiphinematobacter sp.]QQY11708.1 MAG: VTT domain-containing protein [Candidatus Xiphinematobacter sp.]